jgi:SAM-dependent methyltransferase
MKSYLDKQREFWNVDPIMSKFGRVDTVSADEIEYDRMAERHFEQICADVKLSDSSTILEIGCGVGRLLSRMQRLPHAKLIGVDISSNMIDLSQENLAPDSRLHLFVTSGADLSMIDSDSVDFCYANDVFIHIADVSVVISYFEEVARILKQKGLFRFNVRQLDINRMFSNSLGGLAAKASYLLGLRSGVHQYSPGNEGFSGLKFHRRDLVRIARAAGLIEHRISSDPDPSGGRFLWCDCSNC